MTVRLVPVGRGVSLAVSEHDGVARPVLLVHGLASNLRLWDGVVEHLVDRGHRVVAVDLRGHGQSSKPDTGYDFPTLVEDLRALAGALELDGAVVAGQSMGGNLAVALAASGVAPVAAVVGVDGGAIDLQARYATWDACVRDLAPPDLRGTPAEALEASTRAAHPDWDDRGVAAAMANFQVLSDGTVTPWLSRDRHLSLLRALWEHRPLPHLAELRVPATLVPSALGLPAGVPSNVRVVPFEGADHDVHVERPAEVAQVIAEAAP